METPLFFKNNNYNLFGVLHEPDQHASALDPAPCTLPPVFSPLPPAPCTLTPGISPLPPAPSTLSPGSSTLNPKPCSLGFVFCHPFAEEKLISHRVMVNFARSLAKAGIVCLRFDYMGHGDSSGNFEDATVQTRLSDIKGAVEYLREQCGVENIALLGVRLGATLACLANEDKHIAEHLILISPIIDGNAYVEQCLRSNLTTQLAAFKKITSDRKQLVDDLTAGKPVNIDGYLLTGTLYKELQSINLLATCLTGKHSILLIHTARKDNEPVEHNLQNLCTHYTALGSNVDLLSFKVPFFWTDTRIYIPYIRILESTIVDWLNTRDSLHS